MLGDAPLTEDMGGDTKSVQPDLMSNVSRGLGTKGPGRLKSFGLQHVKTHTHTQVPEIEREREISQL